MDESRTCLVTGATGYVGGRLAPRLLSRGHSVRALARTPKKLSGAPWLSEPGAEVVEGDLSDRDSLVKAFAGVDVVYHLVHSMSTDADFAAEERRAAENVVAAAQQNGVSRIVYLGGLHPTGTDLSEHLASRAEVGDIMIESPVETVALQAGTLIGSGSASFELIRHLTERLPAMTTPRWVHNRIQPIAVDDALHYLVEAATARVPSSRTWDIGGPDVLEYGDMMQVYADVAGLRPRIMVVLPYLTPALASRWVRFVTPIRGKIARPLIESLECDAVCRDRAVDAIIDRPAGGLTPYSEAVALTLERSARGDGRASWANASAEVSPAEPLPTDPDWAGEEIFENVEARREHASVATVWDRLEREGRARGEIAFARSPETLRVRLRDNRFGRSYREYRLRGVGGSGEVVEVTTTNRFFPRGLAGLAYWRLGRPFRALGVPGADPFR
ncbi:NAD(P)H-binding protein [Gordonia lacunae]|uniref:Nucleoside-diphosphate sugar epimerase n=1 Tax=Gordonia lacunae TaxID=417102 RepID=A0A243QF60_9ACTN|nr:NAD(P)H-binding protein [Gordonia lacunae]OUC79433.1 nucleoside-diphosphate sugar epimerase [Gordonia lacunae]